MVDRRLRRCVLAGVLLVVAAACAPVTPTPGPTGPVRTGDQNGSLGACPVFPASSWWNRDVSTLPVSASSGAILGQIARNGTQLLHPDFGGGGAYGIPYVTVAGTEPRVPVTFTQWPEESDPGPYPVPLGAPVENGSDAHVIAVDRDACVLYELYAARAAGDHWEASNGARFDLRSSTLRPDGWTSADAAGLPIFAGLVRYDEVAAGLIDHALRVTFDETQAAYAHPATHWASGSTDATRPYMGMRLRLKASFDTSGYTGQARVVLEALKRYGLIVADNGSDWFVTGAEDTRWVDGDLDQLKGVPATAFEVLDTGERLHTPSAP